jgi:hypothetical protein
MRTQKELKEEWLNHGGLDYSAEDRWLRDKIAELFDVKQPNEAQEELLLMADRHLTLMDLPSGAWPTHRQEFMALAQAEFGLPTSPRGLLRRAIFAVVGLAVAAVLFRLIK